MRTRTALLIGTVEYPEVVLIDAVADNDIGEKFHECRLAHTGLSNKKDGVWCLNVILKRLNDPLLERLYIARPYDQK